MICFTISYRLGNFHIITFKTSGGQCPDPGEILNYFSAEIMRLAEVSRRQGEGGSGDFIKHQLNCCITCLEFMERRRGEFSFSYTLLQSPQSASQAQRTSLTTPQRSCGKYPTREPSFLHNYEFLFM